MVYVHILRQPDTDVSNISVETASGDTPEEQWISAALALFEKTNHYYEVSDKEALVVERKQQELEQLRPETLSQGVQLLEFQTGFMGEDIVLVDGRITTTIHAYHKLCKTYRLVSRQDKYWCMQCNCFAEHKEIGRDF